MQRKMRSSLGDWNDRYSMSLDDFAAPEVATLADETGSRAEEQVQPSSEVARSGAEKPALEILLKGSLDLTLAELEGID